jgi:hypothetical protein
MTKRDKEENKRAAERLETTREQSETWNNKIATGGKCNTETVALAYLTVILVAWLKI